MTRLTTSTNLSDHDDLYQMIVDLHEGRTEEDSRKINAKLILLLMNHVGDREIIAEAIAIAEATAAQNSS